MLQKWHTQSDTTPLRYGRQTDQHILSSCRRAQSPRLYISFHPRNRERSSQSTSRELPKKFSLGSDIMECEFAWCYEWISWHAQAMKFNIVHLTFHSQYVLAHFHPEKSSLCPVRSPAVPYDPILFPILLDSPTHNGNDMSCVPTGSIVIKYLPSHEIMQWFTIDISCHRTTCIYLHLNFVDTLCNVTSCVMIDYSIFGNGCVGIIFESLAIPSIVLRGKRWCVRDQQLENAMIDSSWESYRKFTASAASVQSRACRIHMLAEPLLTVRGASDVGLTSERVEILIIL